MSTSLNRRALVAGAAVLPAIAVPAAAQCVLGGDAELRRLWSEYCSHKTAYLAAYQKYMPCLAAFDAELPPCPEDVLPGHHWQAHQWLWEKRGVEESYRAMDAASTAMSETVDAIQNTHAEGPYGIGVKLAALKSGPMHGQVGGDSEDREEAVISALGDIDRILGASFSQGREEDCEG
jgi:hypothetical protein